MRIWNLEQIRQAIEPKDLIARMEEGFIAYSEGRVEVPPVGHLTFEAPRGDCHIKYGYIAGESHFVVKVATGFYANPDIGLPSSNGLILVFSQRTGLPQAILLDEGWLTDARTAAAGAVAAKYLAPRRVKGIGIVGTGTQARLQLEWLKYVVDCRQATVWGRNPRKAEKFRDDLAQQGFKLSVARRIDELCERCNLVVTTTPSREPLLFARHIQPGTHITAVGADGGGKQEIDAGLFARADLCVVDSLAQCRAYGDSSIALKAGCIREDQLVEIGRVIRDPGLRRSSEEQITIADLTGVAVQDIQAAKAVLSRLPSDA